jgi:curved DNA-binding protein CbpA
MSTVNLYDVLDVSQDCATKDIKNAYKKLVLEFHPDRMGGDEEMFELITHAYNILVNTESRAEYDEIYALSKQTDSSHSDLKLQSKVYYEAVDNESKLKKKSSEDYDKEFKKTFEELDRKHGYSRDNNEKTLSEKSTSQRLRDLELAREQDDIEHIHEKLFDEELPFDIGKFNKAFDEMHKSHSELIPHQGNPAAWNTTNDFTSVFSSVGDYEKLYADENDDNAFNTNTYGSVKLNNDKKKKLSKEDIEKMQPAEYTKAHNYKDDKFGKSLEEKIKARELDSKKFEEREMKDFDTDSGCGGYGIFEQIGANNFNSITWDVGDKSDLKARYQKLLELRNSENFK